MLNVLNFRYYFFKYYYSDISLAVTRRWTVYFFDVFDSGSHIEQQVVGEHESGHSFYHDDGAGNNNRVVPAVNAFSVDSSVAAEHGLRLCDRRRGFEGGAQQQRRAVADSTEDSAAVI